MARKFITDSYFIAQAIDRKEVSLVIQKMQNLGVGGSKGAWEAICFFGTGRSRRGGPDRIEWTFRWSSPFLPTNTMWNTPEGETTFSGPYSLMLANGIRSLVDELIASTQSDDPYELGFKAFDLMTEEQKVWSLYKVAFGLPDAKTPVCELNAYLEATTAGIFKQLYWNVQSELDLAAGREEPDDDIDVFFWRRIIFNAYESKGYNDPETFDEDEKPLTRESADSEKWKIALDALEEEVLWDEDYALDFFYDMPPGVRKESSMQADYYTAIPADPKPDEAKTILKTTVDFCDRIIAGVEKT